MITRTFRQHTADEIEILNNWVTQSWAGFRLSDLLGIAFITAILFAGGGWFLGKGLDYLMGRFIRSFESGIFAPALLLIGVICTIVSVIKGERRRKTSLEYSRRRSAAALKHGRAEVVECDVAAAAELQEYEDEGPGFFLQVMPELLLFLQGQELMYNDFPTTTVVLTRDAHTHCIFDLKHTGSHVKPSRIIETQQFGGTGWLDNGMFIRGNVSDLPDEVSELAEQADALDLAVNAIENSEQDAGGKRD
jgi:hypothetical protein